MEQEKIGEIISPMPQGGAELFSMVIAQCNEAEK
jgi:hypothetical protein